MNYQTDSEILQTELNILAKSIDVKYRGIEVFVSDIWFPGGVEHKGFEIRLYDIIHTGKIVNNKGKVVKFTYNKKTIVNQFKKNIEFI